MQVLEQILLSMLNTLLKKTVEKICNEIHHVQGHSATPDAVLCQSLQLVLRFICGGSGSLLRAQQDQVISSPNDVTCSLDSCVPYVHPCKSSNKSCCPLESKEMQDCRPMPDMPSPEAARLC